MIWTPKTAYVLEPFETEAQLEAVKGCARRSQAV